MPSETSTACADQSADELRRELAEARRELAEAQEQHADTAEILRVISSSPTDLKHVFAETAASAARVCAAYDAGIFQADGDLLRLVAHHGPIPPGDALPLKRGFLIGRAVLERRTIHVADLQAETDEYPEGSDHARRLGHRTILAVPLIRAGDAIGVIAVRRTEVRSFTDRQVELLKIFADQAVIAIENARLFTELQENNHALTEAHAQVTAALEREAASSEVLRVIGSSPTDVLPVFEAIARSGVSVCGALGCVVFVVDGGMIHVAATHGVRPERLERFRRDYPMPLSAEIDVAQSIRQRRMFHLADIENNPDAAATDIEHARLAGYQSRLMVPMVRGDRTLGLIAVTREDSTPFPDQLVELLKTFADQAVIAIENARLFEAEQASKRELTVALERQTATSQILGIISASPGKLEPVFDAILMRARELCAAKFGHLLLFDGETWRPAALQNVPKAYAEFWHSAPAAAFPGTLLWRLRDTKQPFQLEDARVAEAYRARIPLAVATVELGGARTLMGVPLLQDEQVIGAIVLYRTEVQPFDAQQVALLSSFASQAVIAIENARLLNDLRESLQQQTATADVLKVISRSTFDLQPVLEALIKDATKLCAAEQGFIFRSDGEVYHLAADYNAPVGFREWAHRRGIRPGDSSVVGRVALEDRTIQILDAQADAAWRTTNAEAPGTSGVRTLLGVPMHREGVLIGVIAMWRTEIRSFTDKQLALVETFADQAVIAIENARLLNELRESLHQQTATADVLKVISRATFDLPRVLDTLVQSAATLCDSYDTAIVQKDGDVFRFLAHHGPILHTPVGQPRRTTREAAVWRAILDRQTIHLADAQSETVEYPESSAIARRLGYHTMLVVPLVGTGEAVGAIILRRSEVRPFTPRQIELLQTFADQAVIAIENARLFEAEQARTKEVEAKSAELRESLEYQTATSEVLNVISRSPTDVQPVFDTIAQSAAHLCKAQFCHVFRFDGRLIHFAAVHGLTPEGREALRSLYPMPPGRATAAARSILTCAVEEIPDVRADSDYSVPHSLVIGFRSVAAVPMLKDGRPIGTIAVMRSQTGYFPERQIQLMQTFADQAVIAIENTRLFEAEQESKSELTEALEQQTATADVLKVISRSALDVQKVLDALVESAARLCNAYDAVIFQVFGDGLRHVAHHGQIPLAGSVGQLAFPVVRGFITGRAVIDRRTIQVADILAEADEYPESLKIALELGYRTALAVPLVHAGEAIGVIFIRRAEMRPFTERQIELVKTFADQAVIAIENTRLFEEVQARTRELTVSLDQQTSSAKILSVISATPGEVQPVFDTILAEATRLCEAQFGVLTRFDGTAFIPVGVRGDAPELMDHYQAGFRPSATNAMGRILRTKEPVHLADAREGAAYKTGDPAAKSIVEVGGARSYLLVPLLKDNEVVGAITIFRKEVRPFSGKQIELLASFADQAVIAIENARLFEEVQARTRELTESLEYQTATSEVLSVISRSPSELQPVLDSIAETASRLCQADFAYIYMLEDRRYRLAAINSSKADYVKWLMDHPISPSRGTLVGRVSLEKQTVHIPDNASDPEYTWSESRERGGFRTMLGVPLILDDVVVGVVALVRRIVQPFSDKQIALITTFANQAVIAVNNVHLFDEVQARNRDLTALGEVGRAVSSTLDLKVVLKTIVNRAVELSGTDAGSIFYHRPEAARFELGETTGLAEEVVERFRKLDIAAGQTGLGEAIASRQPLQVPEVVKRPTNALRDAALEAGLHAALIVPLLGSEGALGALVLQRRQPGEFPKAVVTLMESFADQSAIALENARLFEEIARKSRELEIASQHKSQFVANMSHELRTPLAAILGYAELMQEGFYGNQSEKSMDALTRIRSNGKHLLGLINTVLDIAKIESGQFTLNMAEYAMESVVETVRSATESLAQNKKLALKTEVAKSLPIGLGDEQRLTQVLLNLVGNAIKFTHTGEVRVTAKAGDGHFNISVTDTGPGIPDHERTRIFEQFHQVDSSLTKAAGGTGLGLAIAKQIVEMHGGRIWVESTLGKGSTFQMELPTRAQFRRIGQ
jgi:GAF domain-containing protein/anti-sigma regulatory factor (Ser/Thr protein kinase)